MSTLEQPRTRRRPTLGELLHHAEKMAEIAVALHEDHRTPAAARVGPPESPELVVAKLIHQAGHRAVSVRTSCPGWPASGESQLFHHLQTELLERGAAMRLLVGTGAGTDVAGLRGLAGSGARVRMSSGELPVMTIVDGRTCLLGSAGEHGRVQLAVVHDPAVVRALQVLHDTTWTHAFGIDALRDMDIDWDDESVTRQVLRLLGAGYTDETAARKLNLSVRTYRRHIAHLMARLKAKSRFQAGVLAAALGLIEPEQFGSSTPGPGAAPPGR
ncbi:helix-turn-helix transcriptional regulator [Saccharopolyspora erythraea]|uniref:helix-turn-helix transcriptional regulator n=1 Tax=Saccharopolyspora erythraea TaxID=1836 RepID=UPI001BA56DB1|nr:helix-turn-helix transcriptional regulator [Saccharopolyspora erythraea]QUH02508.1 helix-turn-helix transcriptional regulator [Saccharopolyspora erythraea]